MPKKLFDVPYSTVLLDTNGKLMNAIVSEDGQWRFPMSDSIPLKFKSCIIEFEDKNFYSHWGVSISGITRALWQNFSNGEIVSGGSTITMQVMRMHRGRKGKSYWQKLVEMTLATRLEWSYSKDEILNMYAANAPMGGNVIGLEAASWRYFGRSPFDLSWAETAMLAVLPNSPSLIHLGKNRDLLFEKRNRLLLRLFNNNQIDSLTYQLSIIEPLPSAPHDLPQESIHLLNRAIKEGRKGMRIETTIELETQKRINNIVDLHSSKLEFNEIYNAAAIVVEMKSGKVLSYVGNSNIFKNLRQHHTLVDVIDAPRSSGSILKPFLYYNALKSGLITPQKLLIDIPTSYKDYSPANYSNEFFGAIKADDALAKSLNIPFVRLLDEYSVQGFKNDLQKLGMTTLINPASHYGLSLILGGAEVKLYDLMIMYRNMVMPLLSDSITNVHYTSSQSEKTVTNQTDLASVWKTVEAMLQVERPNEEQNWQFFNSSKKIAWKTGTSYGFRDAWSIGFDSKYIVGVWVGNADGEGRPGLIGVHAAAPLLFSIFNTLPNTEWFQKPIDELYEMEVCSKSGYKANENCESIEKNLVPKSSLESEYCPYHQKLMIENISGKRVNSNCANVLNSSSVSWFILPPEIEFYYKKRNPDYIRTPAYKDDCTDESTNVIGIIYPRKGKKIFIPIGIDNQRQEIVLEATHSNPEETIYWHLDHKYIGYTRDIHQIKVQPIAGEHVLNLTDSKGNFIERKFMIEE